MKPRCTRSIAGRAAVVAGLLLLTPPVARAQTHGTIVGTVTDAATGKPVAGVLVTATSPSLQGEQAVLTDERGHYTITLLPPGRYRIAGHLQGYLPNERRGLALRVDYTLRANLVLAPEAVRAEEQVVRTGLAPAVNVGTAEEGAVISREYLATVPTTRDYEGTLIVVPTALRDQGGVSFAGATSPENNYLLDGFRVGDPSANYLGANLLTNFVDQLSVKIGGYLPEYGYSEAGVVNTVIKSGSNEFHGSIWGNLTPGIFSPAGDVLGRNGEAVASYATPYKGSYDADFGLEVGGPIVKDRLWFYAGVAAQLQYSARTGFYRSRVPSAADPNVSAMDPYGLFAMQAIPGSEFVYGGGLNKIYGVAKLTWLVGENHNLFASVNTQPATGFGRGGVNGTPSATRWKGTENITNVILGYGGKFLDRHLLLEANLGWYDSPYHPQAITVDGVPTMQTPRIGWTTMQPLQNFDPTLASSCPYESRQAGIGLAPGCYVQGYATGGSGWYEESTTTRLAGTVSLSALIELLGQHVLKGGVQIDYAEYSGTRGATGGATWAAWGRFLGPGVPGTGGSFNAFSMDGFGQVDPASAILRPDGSTVYANWCTSVVDGRCVNPGGKDPGQPGSVSVRSRNWSNGYYLQDSWTIANVLTLGFGVRLDTQQMTGATPTSAATSSQLQVSDSWAPRVQAVWDFTGQGRGKIQANWGRYYESIPLGIGFGLLGTVPEVLGSYQLSTCTAAMIPGPASQGNPAVSCPNVYGLAAGQGPGPNTRDLGPSPLTGAGFSTYNPSSVPVAPGLKGQYTDQFGGGVQYEVLQDLTLGVDYIGRRQGTVVEDMSSNDAASYFIANPGVSQPWTPTEGPYAHQAMNPRNAASLDTTSGTVYLASWPTPIRSYDAVTVSLTKLFSRRWLAQASYTWSSLRGNYSGLIRTDVGQYAPNWTSEFDLTSLMGNRFGPLGSNRTHQVKAAASYLVQLDERWQLVPGFQLQAVSGRPANAFGRHPLYGNGDSFLVPRGMAGDLPWFVSLDLSARVSWVVAGPYTLSFTLSVFNVLDAQATSNVDERYTTDFTAPMQGAQCGSKNAIQQKDPLAAIRADCPDLPYARTLDGRAVTPNLNYGRPTGLQAPISARLGVALSF
jgi:hypothetical protein